MKRKLQGKDDIKKDLISTKITTYLKINPKQSNRNISKSQIKHCLR